MTTRRGVSRPGPGAHGLRMAAALALSLATELAVAEEKHYTAPLPPPVAEGLSRDERVIVRAFERVNPAVVMLLTEETEIAEEYEELFVRPTKGIGSGVVISEQGEILTAAHVVSGTSKVKVRFLDGTDVDASIVFSDTASDLAIVRLSGGHPAVLPAVLGDSDRVQVGQTALVIGAPLGAGHTLSVGHISARRRENEIFGGGVVAEMLQTDAAVNQGNSGGPLVTLKGEVIGIVSRILTTTGGSQGLGFAISSKTIKGVLGEDPVPWFGVHAVFVDPELTRALHIPSEGALLVQSVMEGSPADKADIRGGDLPAHLGEVRLLLGGDVILAIEGQRTCHRECIAHEILGQAGAEGVTLTLWREGREVRMEIPVEHPHILERTGQAGEKGNEQER